MTLPQAASAAPVSEPAPPDDTHRAPDSLICPARHIFDTAAVTAAIDRDAADGTPVRQAAVAHLRDALAAGREAIATAFAARPFAAREAVSSYSYLTDRVVALVFELATTRLHANPTPTEGEHLSVFAVGGYGRAEMAPFSDVDLLFVSPWKLTPWAESVIESMLYIFWDLHLKVGHSSRTVKECLRLGRDDYTIRTALLEHRFLGGDAALDTDLSEKLWSDLFEGTGSDYVEAKLAEREQRHRKQGGQRYIVEPNVKEGKGGLRDLQTLFWIAKYVNHVQDAADLVDKGLFTQDEFDECIEAENFLLAVRCHLHLIAGRAMDQLTFDMQIEVAERMGFVDKGGRRGVEHFMQAYFRHATTVGELTRIFLSALEADHVRKAPRLKSILRRPPRTRKGFRRLQNRLAFDSDSRIFDDPLYILRIFEEALRTGLFIHPDALRQIAANLRLIDDPVRRDPDAARIFFDLLLKYGNPERGLRRMNEIGVLGAYLPEFERIVAMMQFNMYHHFTVDEHIIQCVSTLSQIEREELVEELPIASRILKNGVDRKVMYIALLLHDIGKGMTEDHSVVGARIARKVCPRLGMKQADTDTVEWLVRYHLLMSDMAQKRDLADPRTIRDFAKAVRTTKRLDLLTVLTVCDIRGVGPGTWNNWKAQLLRTLYSETAHALENGLEALNRETRGAEARRQLREALSDWDRATVKRETKRHYPPYWQGMDTVAHVTFAHMLRGLGNGDIRIDLTPDEDRDATRVCFAMVDHPGIFSRLAGALALVGANVVDARTYTTKDGFATAVFWVQDIEGSPYDEDRLPRLRSMIERTLHGEVVASEALESRDKMKKRERPFRVPTSITFDNDGSEIYTIIEVDTRDRAGLLYDLTRTLANANISISSAVIATYGAQVVDSFYVKDMFGLKIHSAQKRQSLEKKLREAIDKGAERARR
ncbi:UTP--GlnB (protein PII) uridylyltransferase, GlnD [Tranquillimonas rosea]|uniref:Bifunctional uridylyltransferase/uridylyl-removing enzyme n=1 Tax=Tranquillimonas rosea TaxID=641238 RepID=A0A1H9S9Z5_9RHOB|nr:[protein-PII] uridylyltransferase [Tranquillimonas rosea]SER81824.1 UTP--GlnB (protein PII) uridylyltransferase, GlnD [Tranquillimonas rosea]